MWLLWLKISERHKCPHKYGSTDLFMQKCPLGVSSCVSERWVCGWWCRWWGDRVGFTVARLPDSPTVGHLWAQCWLFVSQHSALQPQGSNDPTGCTQSALSPETKPHSLACQKWKKNPIQISKWSQRTTKLRLHMHTLKSYQWLASIGGYSNTCDWLTANSGNKDCFSIKRQSCEFGRVTQGWCAPQGLLELSAHFSSVTISNPHSTWFQFCAKSMNAECYCLKSLIVNCKWSCGSRGWLWWEFLSCHLACKSGDVTRLLWLHFTISAAFKQAYYIC